MGRFVLWTATLWMLVWFSPAFPQDDKESPDLPRELAEFVLKLRGQVEIRSADGKTQRVRKASELPEADFQLTGLDFGGQSRVTDAELDRLGRREELVELNLSDTRITDQGLKRLEKLPALRRLYLAETAISDEALKIIAGFENLESLDLSGTKITDRNLSELKKLPRLSRLFLGRTNITGEAAEVLAKFSKLSVLHLLGTELSAEAVSALGRLPELKELSLTTDCDGLGRLAELPGLKILTVHGAGVGDDGVPALAKLRGLVQLRLSQTGVSEQGVDRLEDSLEHCQVMAHPISRQSAFLISPGPAPRPVLHWRPGEAESAWPGLISRPAKLPGMARWQIETRDPRSEIHSVDFHPNGQQVACGTAAGHLRIYNAQTLVLEHLIPAHPGGVHIVEWSPDGTRIASGGRDGMVRIWTNEGILQHELKGHRNSVTALAFSPDGQWVASGSWDATVRLWKADGSESRELKGHTKAVHSLAWGPDSRELASGSSDATIRIWDRTGREQHVMKGHTDAVTCLTWNESGSRLASGSWDHTIRFWNPRTGRGGPVLEGHTYRVYDLEWHPQGSLLASAGDRTLRLWTLDGTPIRTVKTERDQILAMSWRHDGSEVALGIRGESVLKIVGVDDESERAVGTELPGGVAELAWHPSGDRIAAGCRDRTIRLLTEDGRSGAILSGHTYVVRALKWSPDGERLASSGDSVLRLWNRQGIPLKTLKQHTKGILGMDYSPNGRWLTTVAEDGTARVWSADGEMQKVIHLKPRARQVAWGPDSEQFAALSESYVKILSRDGTPAAELPEPPGNMTALAWNQDTDQIAAGGWSRTLQFWDSEGQKVAAHKQPQAILDIAVHPQGKRIALGLFNNRAVVADADGSGGRDWEAHAGTVYAVAWHPQGHTLATGGYDNTLKFWDAETLEPRRTVLLFGNGNTATFTAAGQLEQGDLGSLESSLVYVVETEGGKRLLLSPSEFEQRLQGAGQALSRADAGS